MNLSKKTMTRLLNADFRKKIIESAFKKETELTKQMKTYAKYIVDNQILARDMAFENDKSAMYGFQPINIICYVKNDNSVEKKFFEFKQVNHFLKNKNGLAAFEVVLCMLALIYKEEKQLIKNFNLDIINKELEKIEAEMLEKQKQEKEEENKENTDTTLSVAQ